MRVAVYTDAVFHQLDDGYGTDETFVVFAADLRDHVDEVILLGRGADTSGKPTGALHRLRPDVEVITFPHYGSLTHPLKVGRALSSSLTQFARVLGRVDGVWLLGPHPFAMVFAVMTIVRRRTLVLGVRQDFPTHQRTRHPDRPLVHAAADVMELLWRALAWRRPVAAVGTDLAAKYRRGRPTRDVMVSLSEADDIVDEATALSRTYDDEIELLWVGRLDPEKNPLLLVDLLRLLDATAVRWRLVVCGDGVLRPELDRRLAEAGLRDRVHLAGFLTLDELRVHYRQADILLHTSWTEGVPQVLFEAFAAGLPTVATDVGGVRASTVGAALLVEAGDAEAMAQAIQRMTTDPSLRCALVRRGLELAAEHTGHRQRRRLVELFG